MKFTLFSAKTIQFTLLLLVVVSCGKVPTPEPSESILHFIGDFEKANLDGFHFLVKDTAINTQIVTSPVRKGTFALENVLNQEDYVFNGYRTELALYDCAKYKTEVYYGFSFRIDKDYSDLDYNLICQWQDLPNYLQGEDFGSTPVLHGSSPPVAMIYANGKLELRMNENPRSDNHTYLVGNAISIVKEQWYDLVFHIYWTDDSSAYIEAWINGVPFTPFNGVDNKFYKRNLFTRVGNYFKFGQYRGKNKTAHSNSIYFDEIKVGSSYSEVAP